MGLPMQIAPGVGQTTHPAPGDLFLHVKSGGRYRVIGQALLERDLQPVVMYQGLQTGRAWVRPHSEFVDGRFEPSIPGAQDPLQPGPPVYVSDVLQVAPDGTMSFSADGMEIVNPGLSQCGGYWVGPMHYGFSARTNDSGSRTWYERDFLLESGIARMSVEGADSNQVDPWKPLKVTVRAGDGMESSWVVAPVWSPPDRSMAASDGIMHGVVVSGRLRSHLGGTFAFLANGKAVSNPTIGLDGRSPADPRQYGFNVVGEGQTWITWGRRFVLEDGKEADLLAMILTNECDGSWLGTYMSVQLLDGEVCCSWTMGERQLVLGSAVKSKNQCGTPALVS